jgi:hypothetical protein
MELAIEPQCGAPTFDYIRQETAHRDTQKKKKKAIILMRAFASGVNRSVPASDGH